LYPKEENVKLVINSCFCALLMFPGASHAQTAATPAGHWEGSITVPSMELKVLVDLALDAGGQWIGDIDIPQQGTKDLRLKGISVAGRAVTFELTAGLGQPTFKGRLSEDGKTISGDFVQAGNSFPFSLARTGEARVYAPAKNAELPAAFVGKWEGTLETPGGRLRLVFNLTSKAGSADGTIDSLDQGAMGIPMDEISVTNGTIRISAHVINGSYTAKLSEDGKTLTGAWSQRGGSLPLVLTRAGM
jgi:hypothetical protein